MLGAIAGDIIGSVYEHHNIKWTRFPLFRPLCRFTDDTVHTVALAESTLDGKSYGMLLKSYYRNYPHAGYGGMFHEWARSTSDRPYNSFGNGSAMRVSPVGFAYDSLDEVLLQAKRSAEVTHDHPEGIKGAQAIASAIFLARTGQDKEQIKSYLTQTFRYNLERTLDEIRPAYDFNVTCQGSVPQAITAFLESSDFEDAVRKAISLGGDSDTIACMAGGIAQAYYGRVPEPIVRRV
ncbi:MAG: ADP-ribosylglycohydrolase family protein [Isosphaeraceae bacterium]